MKFKATLEDPRAFVAVLQVCRSIRKVCIVRLQSVSTRFFTGVEAVDGVQVWVRCRTDRLFGDFRCVSQYKEQSITCEVLNMSQLEHICRRADLRTRSGSRAYRTVIRLARNGVQPVWKMAIHGLAEQPDLSYDVPVRILSDAEIERMYVPPLEEHRMQVVLPKLPEMTIFIDKLRTTACESVTFRATRRAPSCRAARRSDEPRRLSASASALSRKGPPHRPHTEFHEEDNEEEKEDDADGVGHRGGSDVRPGDAAAVASLRVSAEHMFAQFCLQYDRVELVEQQPPRSTDGEETKHDDDNDFEEEEEEEEECGEGDSNDVCAGAHAEDNERAETSANGEGWSDVVACDAASRSGGARDRDDRPCRHPHTADRARMHKKPRVTRRRRVRLRPDCTDASVTVHVDRFARFLSTVKEINPPRVSLYLVHQRALVLSAYDVNNMTMVAYIPARAYP